MSLPDWSLQREEAAAPYIDAAANGMGIPRDIAYGVVSMESRFNPAAYRAEPQLQPPDASYGLTQILYQTAKGIGYEGTPAELFDPAINVYWGMYYLLRQLERYQDVSLALSAYNGGLRNGKILNPAYVSGVLQRAEYFRNLWSGSTAAEPIDWRPLISAVGLAWLLGKVLH